MDVAALVTWIVTAGFGFSMLTLWVRGGGTRTEGMTATTSHFRPPVVFGHFTIAVIGLVLWIIYLLTDTTALAWIAFGVLVAVAILGETLVIRWARDRRSTNLRRLAEQQIPPVLVGAHGIFAVATIVLVFLSALGVGGS